MHINPAFKQENMEQLEALIRAYPFATLITGGGIAANDLMLDANHIPFILSQSQLLESKGSAVLQGHIAKANPLWQNVKDGSDVLVVFSGPNHYISPNHYPTKKATGKAVPTWNYVVVHVRGRITYIHDKAWNLDMINRLTEQHESGEAAPWSVNDAPDEYIQKMLAAIVGIEIEILSMTGQWKLSQNQPEQNQQGIITALSRSQNMASQDMASLIESQIENQASLKKSER